MNLYSRALRHIDMKDVKEKYERKVIEKKMVEESEKKYNKFISSLVEERRYDWRKEISDNNVEVKEEIIINDSKISRYNWREKIEEDRKKYFEEGMTTSGMVYTTLGATGDTEYPAIELSSRIVSFPGYFDASLWTYDSSYYNEIIYDVRIVGDIALVIELGGAAGPILDIIQSSGTHIIPVPQSKNLQLLLSITDNATGVIYIDDVRFRRTTPLNVFVSLDSPEASAFIRTDPIMANLSPQERQQKLKEMLEASDEYLFKLFGSDFPGSGAVPPGESGETPGVEVAGLPPGMYPYDPLGGQAPAPKGYQAPGTYDPKQFYQLGPNTLPSPNLPRTPPGLSQGGGQDTQIASEPLRGQRTDVKYDPVMKMFVPRPSDKDSGTNIQDLIKRASANKTAMVASYEPQGQIISERKKLKSPQEILNKIPGYYDGKPAPLGFPEVPPPKMVNGMHPDLVDGKKVANRFNRLDPESARAMPSTGNPYIDKKVKAAAKKPK